MRRLALTSVAALYLSAAPATAADAELEALVGALARPAPAATSFAEVRFSRLLSRPLTSYGTLRYLGPGHLTREVDAPFRETTEIRGGNVSVSRAGEQPRRFALRRAPELGVLIGSFTGLLSGDVSALERWFVLDLERQGDGEARWQLRMTPRDTRTRRRIDTILLTGSAAQVHCLVMLEPDADASVLLLGDRARVDLPAEPERAMLGKLCDAPQLAQPPRG